MSQPLKVGCYIWAVVSQKRTWAVESDWVPGDQVLMGPGVTAEQMNVVEDELRLLKTLPQTSLDQHAWLALEENQIIPCLVPVNHGS